MVGVYWRSVWLIKITHRLGLEYMLDCDKESGGLKIEEWKIGKTINDLREMNTLSCHTIPTDALKILKNWAVHERFWEHTGSK